MGGPGSRRRTEGGFLGADKILTKDGKFAKVARKRVGIMGMKAPARDHTEIFDATGETKIGGNHFGNLFSVPQGTNRHGVCRDGILQGRDTCHVENS
jgi:hypothetical protein